MSGYIGNIPVPQATQTRDVFTATSGQTTFATSGYTPGFLDVWLNGVKLVNGTDFTATNGSDVVLSSGAATSDIVEVLSYSTYEVNNQAFTGDFSVDGTTFKVDSTNNRVGVGTATPDSPFVVNGSGARQKITDGTNTLSMGQFDGLTNQVGSAGRDLYLLASSNHAVKFGTNNTERMNIDTSGRVTMPYQPAFVAYKAPTYLTNNINIVWGSTALNRGSVYNTSNGRFTAPVAGLYQFFASVRIESGEPAATYHRVSFVHNGSDITWSKSRLNSRTATGYYSHAASDQIIGCQAGDYVNVKFESGGVSAFTTSAPDEHVFYGYLIG